MKKIFVTIFFVCLVSGSYGQADKCVRYNVSNGFTFETISAHLAWLGAQPQLSGTGFVKISGTTISYDNSTYLTTAAAAAAYQPIGSYLTANQSITLSGDITGTGTTSITTTIGNLKVTNAMLAGSIAASKLVLSDITLSESQVTSLTTDLAAKEPSITAGTTAQYYRGDKSWQTLNAAAVGLGNVTNESKATMFTSPTFTGTVSGITASMVGLGNVTNESKATMFTSPTFTGTVSMPAGSITNTMLAGSIAASKLVGSDITLTESQITNLTSDLALKAPLASPTFTGTVTLPNNTVTNAMLAGSIDLTTKVTGVLPFANGGIGASAATSATTGTMTVNMTTEMITITPTGACTFNASGGVTGQRVTFVITTSGTTSQTLTWGTNFKTAGTLATGTTTAKIFTVSFVYNGSTWLETGRTTAM